MKEIRIKSVSVENFKCFTKETFLFPGNNVNIRGRNGSGKTTIGDAITYCLFGKNLAGQTDFDIKTHDKEGNTIPHLDHSVEIVFDDNTSLKRVLKENWVKKRGGDDIVFKSNTTEYFINGSLVTAGDYKKFVSSLCSEDIFRIITNPDYFTSLKWQDQRMFLASIAGEITDEEIVSSCPTLEGIKKKMGEQSLEDYKKHISYNIRKVKEELQKIPVKLQENAEMKPEERDWDTIRTELNGCKERLKELDEQLIVGGVDSEAQRIAGITKKINAVEEKMMKIRRTTSDEYLKEEKDRMTNLNMARNKFIEASKNISDLNDKLNSYGILGKRCEETLVECERKLSRLRDEWKENAARIVALNEKDTLCPTCGRALTKEMVYALVEERKTKLNDDKARRKEELNAEAEKIKCLQNETKDQIEKFKEDWHKDNDTILKLKKELNDKQATIKKYETPVKSEQDRLMDNEEYVDLIAQKEMLKNEKEKPTENNDFSSIIEEKKKTQEKILALQNTLANENIFNNIKEREKTILKEKADFVSRLSELEMEAYKTDQYQKQMSDILEKRVNKMFTYVKWKMFRTVNNNGDPYTEPYCECYVDGTAYHNGLNKAAKLNAGLDIINMLCGYYEICAPILIDNAEAANLFLVTKGQQLKMFVNNGDLTID